MPQIQYNHHNFFKNTFCVFSEIEVPERLPDYESRSGSQYWFTPHGVTRNANHWGRAAKCKWRLVSNTGKTSRQKCGFAKWSDFARDNEHEKLYFIQVENGIAHYFHKDSEAGHGFLRTSADTQKRLRQIRNYIATNRYSEQVLERLVHSGDAMHVILKLVSPHQFS